MAQDPGTPFPGPADADSAGARGPGLSVRVPASTSNLGPGFDALGLALSLYLEVRVLGVVEGEDRVEADSATRAGGQGLDWPAPAHDLLLTGLRAARAAFAPGAPRLRLQVASAIPIARGLGSSAAAIAAGLSLGAAFADRPVHAAELLRLGVELEGHPDNIVPVLSGGLCLAVPLADRPPRVVSLPLHPELGWSVAWPPDPVTTRRAREVLPDAVPFADAVENPRRLALLLEGLRTADPELLRLGGEDRLHVRHRLPLIPRAELALRAARDAGAWLATISGSGSALLAIGPRDGDAAVADAMAASFEGGTGHAVRPVLQPTRVVGAATR